MGLSSEKYLQSICNHYLDIPFSWDDYVQKLDDERQTRKKDVALIHATPVCMKSDATEAPDGRFYTDIGSAHIEGFLKKGNGELLYVFFDGARTRNQGKDLADVPHFSRWSWYMHTEGSVLSLEDPMYYRFEKCKLGWFYGTQDEDYRKACAECVDHIASLLGVERKNVVLYGSSGGGSAAVGVSVHLPGCITVAINPQLKLDEYDYTPEFEEVTGVKIIDVLDPFGRNDPVALIQSNPMGRYLIIINARSKADFSVHLRFLCEELGISPCYGIKRKENICTWVYNALGAPDAHTSLETTTLFHTIECLIRCLRDDVDLSELEGLYRLFNEFWYDHYQQLKKNKRLENKHNKEIKKINSDMEKIRQENDQLKRQLEELSAHSMKEKIKKWIHN